MAEKTTIARPYAKAAFQEAQGDKDLGPWSAPLGRPSVSGEDLAQFVMGVTGPALDEHRQNFFRMLAENHRLGFLPEISALFDEYKDEAESRSEEHTSELQSR